MSHDRSMWIEAPRRALSNVPSQLPNFAISTGRLHIHGMREARSLLRL